MKNRATNPAVIIPAGAAGNRDNGNGSLNNQGSNGNYWSSSVSGTNASNINFNSSAVNPSNTNNRANGFSARCVQDSQRKKRNDGGPELLLGLFRAYFDARKNKRSTANALAFEEHYEENVFALYEDIRRHEYKISRSLCFIVDKPVKREIFAADFRDRVVHHLLFNWLSPVFEPHFIKDSYSCRKGKGTSAGINRLQHFMRSCSENYAKECWVLKLDVQGYFMSMDRTQLYTKIERKLRSLKNPAFDVNMALYLLKLVVFNDPTKNYVMKSARENWNGLPKSKSLFFSAPGKGFPVGNLTSQLFSNIYLDDFDHWIREELGIDLYGRYVDDMVFVHRDKEALKALIPKVGRRLFDNFGLTLHPKKIYLQEARNGIGFLGTFIKPWRIYIGRRTKRSFYTRLGEWNALTQRNGGLNKEGVSAFIASINSYLGFLRHYDTFKLRGKATKLINAQILRCVVISDDFLKVSVKAAIVLFFFASIGFAVATPASAATAYTPNGTLVSKNLLAGTSASGISNFYYKLSSLPGNSSVTIQFSEDGTNWYSAAGVLGGSTSLTTLGGANLSLSTLSWSGGVFYYRLTLNATSDQTGSPSMTDVRLDYTPATGYDGKLTVNSTTGNVQVGGGTGGGSALSILGGAVIGANYLSATTTNGLLVEGQVGIGTSSPDMLLTVGSNTPSGSVAHFENSTGSCYINPTTTSLSCSSDLRLKTNLNVIDPATALAAIDQLSPTFYNWKTETPGTLSHAGFIAQQVQPIFPDLVSQGPDGYYTLNYAGFTPYLSAAVQALDTRIATTTLSITTLNATTTTLAAQVGNLTSELATLTGGSFIVQGSMTANSLIATTSVQTANLAVTNGATINRLTIGSAGLTVSGSVSAAEYDVPADSFTAIATALGFASSTLPSAVLTADGQGVDAYKLAVYNLGSIQALAAEIGSIDTRLTSLETRVTALESGAVSSASGTPTFSASTTELANALSGFGVFIQKGIAQFNTLVFQRLVAATDSTGASSAGSVAILTGNTVAQVNNSLVLPTTKVFVTFNSQITGSWWVSDKAAGSFRVVLSVPQTADVSFDYFLVQTEGQLATSSPEVASGASDGQSQLDTTPPVITILGDNPAHVSVGGVFVDPGVSVVDNVDGTDPVVTYINGIEQDVSSTTIDTSSPTTYSITYKATDQAGNVATAIRSVVVGNVGGSDSGGSTPPPSDDSSQASSTPSDTTPPVVTLNGSAALTTSQGSAFTDPGATATDAVDGDLTAKIVETGSVDVTTAGTYTLTYSATDAAGNTGSVSRVVTVIASSTTP